MIRSILGSATQRFIEKGSSRFSRLDEELARQRLAELHAAPSLNALGKLNSVGLHKHERAMENFVQIRER
jgi:hypothetical protein